MQVMSNIKDIFLLSFCATEVTKFQGWVFFSQRCDDVGLLETCDQHQT